jgi:uncharacterized membrane protein
MTSSPPSRLAYIDWMRGLACVLMFQTHCYDSWLGGDARKTKFLMWSQIGGTLPAPLFLFLAGISFALVTDKLCQKGWHPNQIAHTTIRRGAEIFALGLLFRLQEFVISWGWAPWSDLFRVDVLNIIGLSMMLMGASCWITLTLSSRSAQRLNDLALPTNAGFLDSSTPRNDKQMITRGSRTRACLVLTAAALALIITLVTPPLWTTWRPRWLPWPLESYVNGVHNLNQPQSWLFPMFPWAGFAFTGLATGFILLSDWARKYTGRAVAMIGVFGVALIFLARWFDRRPQTIYAVYDFWHTSPNFFVIRVAILFLILLAAYAWCRWGLGTWGFSPLVQLGQTSLLVYWVHIEFVYGRLSILPKKAVTVRTASFGLLAICLSMLLLSVLRTRMKGRGPELWLWLRRPLRTA